MKDKLNLNEPVFSLREVAVASQITAAIHTIYIVVGFHPPPPYYTVTIEVIQATIEGNEMMTGQV